jgi:hypothetical protein
VSFGEISNKKRVQKTEKTTGEEFHSQCTKMATISNQLSNIVRPSSGWNINIYILGKQVHDSGKSIFYLTKKTAVLALEALGIPA